jgi:hypothetical protein
MTIPQFWAEGRAQRRINGRLATVRRFGWSDTNQDDAQAKADHRATEALGVIASGGKLARREPKVAYNGADGVPIREEILSRHGTTVVTRNIYGARCLNTPDVLFADVDLKRPFPVRAGCGIALLAATIGSFLGWDYRSIPVGIVATLVLLTATAIVVPQLVKTVVRLQGGAAKVALRHIRRFVTRHPDWSLRIYRTPAGFRLLATHRTFAPEDPEVAAFFHAVRVDPVYARMCRNQQCFRARVSPKPWRIGISEHLKPRPGVWPINPTRLPDRKRWVDSYETASLGFASCEFVESLGSGTIDPTVTQVQQLHDELSRATQRLPIA